MQNKYPPFVSQNSPPQASGNTARTQAHKRLPPSARQWIHFSLPLEEGGRIRRSPRVHWSAKPRARFGRECASRGKSSRELLGVSDRFAKEVIDIELSGRTVLPKKAIASRVLAPTNSASRDGTAVERPTLTAIAR